MPGLCFSVPGQQRGDAAAVPGAVCGGRRVGVVVLPVQKGVPDAEGPGPGVQGAGRGVREPFVR